MARSLASNRDAKQMLFRGLAGLGIAHLPSHTNFAMFRLKDGIETFNRRMAQAGFLVGRPFPPMTDHCRITIGLPEEMESFVQKLRDFRQKGWI